MKLITSILISACMLLSFASCEKAEPEPIEVNIPYELIFTENYTFRQESGRESNVTRTMKLTFKPKKNTSRIQCRGS